MARVQAGNCLVPAEKCKTKKLTGGRMHWNGYRMWNRLHRERSRITVANDWHRSVPRIPSPMSETGTRKAVSSRYKLLFLTL